MPLGMLSAALLDHHEGRPWPQPILERDDGSIEPPHLPPEEFSNPGRRGNGERRSVKGAEGLNLTRMGGAVRTSGQIPTSARWELSKTSESCRMCLRALHSGRADLRVRVRRVRGAIRGTPSIRRLGAVVPELRRDERAPSAVGVRRRPVGRRRLTEGRGMRLWRRVRVRRVSPPDRAIVRAVRRPGGRIGAGPHDAVRRPRHPPPCAVLAGG